MSKFMMFAMVFLLAATLISAASKDRCGRHGDPVSRLCLFILKKTPNVDKNIR